MIKVLLADDQELIRQSLSFVMSKQEDIEMVGTAANGCEALELVEEKQPDVVLLDIRMPEMDGVGSVPAASSRSFRASRSSS